MLLWDWFVATAFEAVPEVPYVSAVGILLILKLGSEYMVPKEAADGDPGWALYTVFLKSMVATAILGTGFILSYFV